MPTKAICGLAGLSVVILLFVLLSQTSAQQGGLDGTPPKQGEGEGKAVDTSVPPKPAKTYGWTEMQLYMVIGIVIFALALFLCQFWVMYMSAEYWTDRQFKAFTLTLILSVGLILIIAGFTDAQIAPMMGLIGTIAGYVLGTTKDKLGEAELTGSEKAGGVGGASGA